MPVEVNCIYEGNLTVSSTHAPSGSIIHTTAPVDNGGTGSLFSPTDLIAASLGSCMLTIMGIVATRDGINMNGARAGIVKHMSDRPRRVGLLEAVVHLPQKLSDDDRRKLEAAARACPAKQTIHPDTELQISFVYDV
jgi:putative redox protein